MGRLQQHSSYHQLSTVQSICLPGDTGNTGDTTSNCDTAMGGTGAVMNHVAVDNSQLCSTHTHIDTHIRAYVHGYIYNSSMHSVHQGGKVTLLQSTIHHPINLSTRGYWQYRGHHFNTTVSQSTSYHFKLTPNGGGRSCCDKSYCYIIRNLIRSTLHLHTSTIHIQCSTSKE